MVYYKYKKERLNDKFNSAYDFLIKIRKAVELYCESPNEIVARGMTGYFSDFTEYIIDICETYLVINDRYNTRLSGVDLIKSAAMYGLMDDFLSNFMVKCVVLRNRFTHDYYKREVAEQDIIKFCHSEIIYLDIFLEASNEIVKLNYTFKA
ncbi:hypothetical protein JOC70_003582 [Clostridium pascui]|uniref:hypothetical protein n=1 Tax=Clostridium pascui TaxID=46609 RepID=UPI001FAF2B51|nr:hypothetical protein [Clostridium pascui]MBM7872034.1 hypothetical protein [Clostridium pascui]